MNQEQDAWYYAIEGRQVGPVPAEQVRQLLQGGQLGANDRVWAHPMPDWQEARQVPAFAGLGMVRGAGPVARVGAPAPAGPFAPTTHNPFAASATVNPYAAPATVNPYAAGANVLSPTGLLRTGLVHQVTGLSIAMLVVGTLSGLGFLGSALGTGVVIAESETDPDAAVVATIFGIGSLLMLAQSVVCVWGGILGLGFRGWGLLLAASIMTTIFGVCSIYGIGLIMPVGIWGLIVLLNGTVKEAFRQGVKRVPKHEILANLGR